MLCAAVRTVHGCGLYVQSLGKLSQAVFGKLQPLRANCTQSGPGRATVSVDAYCEVYRCLSRAPISESVRVRRRRAVAVRVPVLWEQYP